ncbi:MAG: ATP-binding protein [Salinisphaera sp.]|nr:ATP-binding protein [Salinisphaera sp.]
MDELSAEGLPRVAVVLENLTTAVVCTDDALRICHLNPAAEALFGVSARNTLGLALVDALPSLADQRPRLLQALNKNAPYTVHEQQLGQQPAVATVDLTATPLDEAAGSGLVLEFQALDRHLRITREDQLRAQHLANQEMLRGLAHEVKNPLGGLRGAAQLLERELSSEALREYTGIIIREADRLQNLVDRMLGPRQPPRLERLNIHEPLEHVRQVTAAGLPSGVQLQRDYDPSLPEVEADREQLLQVFFNLLGNAVQAVGARGTIQLRSRSRRLVTLAGRQHRLALCVQVIDDGPGIPAALLPRIFLPMASGRAEGSGMGLPIAQQLVHRHGGLIECATRPGKTVFSVTLPVESDND